MRWLLDGQPEPPKYFAQMKKVNKLGPALLNQLPQPVNFDRSTLDAVVEDGGQVFDLRNRGQFAFSHVPGTVNVPADNNTYITYLGWLVDYERPVYLLLPSVDSEHAVLSDLRSIGIDYVPGYFSPEVAAHDTQALPVITARELAKRLPQNGHHHRRRARQERICGTAHRRRHGTFRWAILPIACSEIPATRHRDHAVCQRLSLADRGQPAPGQRLRQCDHPQRGRGMLVQVPADRERRWLDVMPQLSSW